MDAELLNKIKQLTTKIEQLEEKALVVAYVLAEAEAKNEKMVEIIDGAKEAFAQIIARTDDNKTKVFCFEVLKLIQQEQAIEEMRMSELPYCNLCGAQIIDAGIEWICPTKGCEGSWPGKINEFTTLPEGLRDPQQADTEG
jgi:hypothetical protein